MKKKTIITMIIMFILGFLGYQWYERSQWVEVSQKIEKTGYVLSLKYPKKRWNVSLFDYEEAPGYYDYSGGIYLTKKGNEDIYIDFSYQQENNGDDTPHEAGDTGAGDWPPQPEELIHSFERDKYIYLGKYLGKELYVGKEIKRSMGVSQRLKDGRITARMPLLSKDQERVNYYDYFSIIANVDGQATQKDYEKLHREFLKILKTMKIEKIQEKTN